MAAKQSLTNIDKTRNIDIAKVLEAKNLKAIFYLDISINQRTPFAKNDLQTIKLHDFIP